MLVGRQPTAALSKYDDAGANAYAVLALINYCIDDVVVFVRFLSKLYASRPLEPGVPESIPCAQLLPLFNTFAMFAVAPNVSFHSVQEVVASDKWRISIQGTLHTAPPLNIFGFNTNAIL